MGFMATTIRTPRTGDCYQPKCLPTVDFALKTLHLVKSPFGKMDLQVIHSTICAAFKTMELAYAPYSKFQVGAALLCEDGTIVGGCNVENASYGAGICAERTAITKAISSGQTKFLACAVTSAVLTTPSISPCGVCRQVLREFLPLSTPIFMLANTYPYQSTTPPEALVECLTELQGGVVGRSEKEYGGLVRVMTLGELLPMSFGPDHLLMGQ